MEFEVFETERLLLKKLTPELIGRLFENYRDAEIKKQLGLTTEEEFALEKYKNQGGYKTYDRTILSFLIVLKGNNEIIGRCGFHNWYTTHQKAELGYALGKDEHKRKGYMSEAVKSILEYGFSTMNLNRIEACIGPANTASQRLVGKFGFVQEGYLRQHFMRDGELHDALIFALLREDYKVK